MSLTALFNLQVTNNIDSIFCGLQLVVPVNIVSENFPLKVLAIIFLHPVHVRKGFSNTWASNKL